LTLSYIFVKISFFKSIVGDKRMTLITTGLNKASWGPELPEKPSRVKFAYSTNFAPSYVPKIWMQNRDQSLESTQKLKPLGHETPIEDFAEDIHNHAENRIQLFFQQLLLFYKTGLCFEKYFHADAQVGDIKGKGAAAHSGTLPTLRIKSDKSSGSISVGRDSLFYYNWNTTVYLPTVVNHFDSAIDSQRGGRSTLRESALEILNDVSIRGLNPQEGLRAFLTVMISRTQDESRAYQVIAKIYEQVARGYLDNLDNGYPLIQKFCLRPITEKLDDVFYLDVQNKMLGQLIKVSEVLTSPIRERSSRIEWNPIRDVVGEILGTSISKAALTYVRACVKDSTGAIHTAAINYLKYLSPLTAEKYHELVGFLSNSQPILSPKGADLQKEILKFIKEKYKTESPENIPFISGSVFYDINEEVFNSLEPSTGVIIRDAVASTEVHTLIQERITSSGDLDTKTIVRHIATCTSSKKVQKVVIRFFDSLLSMPKSIQKQTLLELGRSEVSGSRDIVLELRSEVKEALGKAQKIPYISLRVLQEINTVTL
jgi:hypothetical protein